MDKNKDIAAVSHSGHRQRMKQRFLTEGSFDSFSDVNILETLLFYAIPMKDTNGIAHALLDRFGSIENVFNASYDNLLSVAGVTPNAACLIAMIPSIARTYFDSATKQITEIPSVQQAAEYLIPKFIGLTHEALYLVALNNRGRILRVEQISSGDTVSTDSNIRKIVSTLLECKATAAIIAHNHPNGLCVPSRDDHKITYEISKVLSSISIRLVDHIIISGDEHFSLASNSRFADCFIIDSGKIRFAQNGCEYETE